MKRILDPIDEEPRSKLSVDLVNALRVARGEQPATPAGTGPVDRMSVLP